MCAQNKIKLRMKQYSAVVFLFLLGSFAWSVLLMVVTILRVTSSNDHNAFFWSEQSARCLQRRSLLTPVLCWVVLGCRFAALTMTTVLLFGSTLHVLWRASSVKSEFVKIIRRLEEKAPDARRLMIGVLAAQ